MLTLYGNLESGNDYKVRLLLAMRGIAHRRVDVWQTRGTPTSPAFLRINPMGKIPVLVLDDGRVLSESGAILHWLARGSTWWPDHPWSQAEVLRWMFFEQYSHEPAIAVNRYWLRFAPPDPARAPRIRENHERGLRALDAMERWLAGSAWFGSSSPSIADIALFAYTHVADEGGFDLGPYRAIGDWLHRFSSLPGHVGLRHETSAVAVVDFEAMPTEHRAPPPHG
ncbi:MAG: glutathione S-transferase family protein [Ectothiorhodospiraceae bacterium]|nr:glutathione S-transferase family protein [Chromatiales bacterium]MCP5156971.1 glutathione S-transferase family protein [Ectothiorhodospiraceae bacterium]